MPSEIALPFALDATGAVTIEMDPDRQISQHVHGLVATQPGERVMLFDYGVNTSSLLFEPDADLVQAELQTEITQALGRFEPGALLVAVKPIPGETGDGRATVEVDFIRSEAANTPRQLSRNINTAILRVGGTVDEQVAG